MPRSSLRREWLRPHRYARPPRDDAPWGYVFVAIIVLLVLAYVTFGR